MSQIQAGNAKVKVGLVEFEGPAAGFDKLLASVLLQFTGLVKANNDLAQNKGQATTAAATTTTTLTPTSSPSLV